MLYHWKHRNRYYRAAMQNDNEQRGLNGENCRGWIRTNECLIQSQVPYHLATRQQ